MIKLNQTIITPTIFPDKTSQIWKLDTKILNNVVNCITWEFENESEFMQVAQLANLLRTISSARMTLNVPYFPYARQDKPISNESTFALRTFCMMLKQLDFNMIVTQDLHSNIAFEYLDNLTSNFPADFINDTLNTVKPDFIVYPDKGAKARYSSKIKFPSITIIKERNQITGDLKFVCVENPEGLELQGSKCLIVDDLCDAGGTFILATKELHNLGVKSVNLYTTHGLYTKGLTQLRESGIIRIFNRLGEV